MGSFQDISPGKLFLVETEDKEASRHGVDLNHKLNRAGSSYDEDKQGSSSSSSSSSISSDEEQEQKKGKKEQSDSDEDREVINYKKHQNRAFGSLGLDQLRKEVQRVRQQGRGRGGNGGVTPNNLGSLG